MDTNLSLIVEYIKQNRDTYTREAMVERLLSSSYKPEEIEAAWQATEQASPNSPYGSAPSGNDLPSGTKEPVVHNPVFWFSMLGLIAVTYGMAWIIGSNLLRGDWNFLGRSGIMLLSIALGILIVVGVIAGFMVLSTNRALGMGLLIGSFVGMVVLPVAALALLSGLCMMAFDSQSSFSSCRGVT